MSDKDAHQQALAALSAFRKSYPLYAANCLKIRTKAGETVPLIFNTAQKYLHMRVQKQIRETGRVRALVLKGRQQGISTYIAGRFYRKASMWRNINVYILAHEQPSSDALFGMVDRFHRHNPVAPKTGKANAKELSFERLESMYSVATAGAKAGGRGKSTTLYHGSETGWWANAADHFASSVQTVPDAPGTEIILETTANGTSGEFYERWQEAASGIGDYLAIFIPWFWQPEYAREVPAGFELSKDTEEGELSEVEYMEMFGLEMEQMVWRRAKIQELRSISLFNQEYPATAELAFQNANNDSYISASVVLRARKRKTEGGGPLIMGVDPAGEGGDRFAVCLRRGHCVENILWRHKVQATEAVEWLDDLIQTHKPARVFVDAGGLGAPVISFLRAKRPEYSGLVKSVNFGSKSQAKLAKPHAPGPKLRRDEMWKRSKEWLELEDGVSIPDMDVLQTDATGPRKKGTLTNDFSLEGKDDMRKRGVRSPDLWDSVVLTFADLSFIENYDTPVKRTPFGSPEITEIRGTGNGQGWQGV